MRERNARWGPDPVVGVAMRDSATVLAAPVPLLPLPHRPSWVRRADSNRRHESYFTIKVVAV